jgi:integrase
MTVYRRSKNGAFYMDYVWKGVRVCKSTGKYTKRDAKIVEAADKQRLQREVLMSSQGTAATIPLSKAIEQTFESRWKTNKDALGTRSRALGLVDLLGDIHISHIGAEAVETMTRALEARNLQPSTINRYLAALKTILKHKKQPYEFIRLHKERKGRIRVLTLEEEQAVVTLLENAEDGAKRSYFNEVAELVKVLVDTGCRLSELLELRYEDVNFETNLISIWINKGQKPRSIPMTRRTRTILEARQAGRVKPFTITVNQAEYAWTWARTQMNLQHDKEFVLHALRHTCASRLVNRGVDLYVVKEWLGHNSIQVTERYAHLNPFKLAEAVRFLERE